MKNDNLWERNEYNDNIRLMVAEGCSLKELMAAYRRNKKRFYSTNIKILATGSTVLRKGSYGLIQN